MLTFFWMEIGALFASRRPDDYIGSNNGGEYYDYNEKNETGGGTRSLLLPLRFSSSSASTTSALQCDADVLIVQLWHRRRKDVNDAMAMTKTNKGGVLVRAIVPIHLIRMLSSTVTEHENWEWELIPGGPNLVSIPVTEPLVQGCGVPIPFPTHWMCSDLLRLVDRLRGRLRTLLSRLLGRRRRHRPSNDDDENEDFVTDAIEAGWLRGLLFRIGCALRCYGAEPFALDGLDPDGPSARQRFLHPEVAHRLERQRDEMRMQLAAVSPTSSLSSSSSSSSSSSASPDILAMGGVASAT